MDQAKTSEQVVLTGLLSEFREALEDEIAQIEKNGQSSTLLSNGQRVESRGTELWYRFHVEYAPSLPADTPCKLVVGTVASELRHKKQRCSEQFEREYSLCNAFYVKPETEDLSALFESLAKLMQTVKCELEQQNLSALRDEQEKLDQERGKISGQLNEIAQKLQELEKQAILDARIVGTTLTIAYLNRTLRQRTFDTVILDEASMAAIPALWCAGCLSEKSLVIVGDFLQLPPIVMANTEKARKWLGEDIFARSGMQQLAREHRSPDNFIMLNEQYRMEPDIAEIANMYYGQYTSLRSPGLASEQKEAFYRWYPGKRTAQHVHLIDTESLHAWVTGVPKGKGYSRLNCFSAAVDVDLAFKFLEKKLDAEGNKPAENASILIVAPYKPHVERLNQLIDLEYKNRGFTENLKYVRAGTIHSFQGSEADIVIFDLVVDEPHWRANLFRTDEATNDTLQKLFNVAITRARFQLFIVGNFNYCRRHAKHNVLSQLLDQLIVQDRLEKLDAKELLPDLVFAKQTESAVTVPRIGAHILCCEGTFLGYFLEDLRTFRRRVIVYSPFLTEQRLSTLLPIFADAISAGKQIIVITKALAERRKSEFMQYQACETELRAIGVQVVHKKGMHEKLIFVDDEVVWIGSLNALSFTGTTGEVMERRADKALTAEYEKIFEIEPICGVAAQSQEQKCPECGSEMLIREGAKGGIYWECANADFSRGSKEPYPSDGILRCSCGATYEFVMKTAPRWVCTKDVKHYQFVRETDLNLPKMAALIPIARRKAVKQYFENKKRRSCC